MKKLISTELGIVILIVLTMITVGFINFLARSFDFPSLTSVLLPTFGPKVESVTKFSSEEEFKDYLQEAQLGMGDWGAFGDARALGVPMFEEALSLDSGLPKNDGGGDILERVSETTVQVLGIDEPDIVKTDGEKIYFSSGQSYYSRGWMEIVPPKMTGETKIINAFPPVDLEVTSEIDKRGDMLLYQNILVIFSDDKIYGYDVSDAQNPKKEWTMDLDEKTYVVAARLYQDKIYLITKNRIDTYHPCPIRPLSLDGTALEIKCVDIYHPVVSVPVDVTYTAIVFNVLSGKTEKTVSFVGTSDSSVVYMSENAIYATYSYYESIIKFFSNFLKEKFRDIIPSWVVEKLDKLESYDISEAAKFTEFTIILQNYYNGLSSDERLRVENELTNRMSDYYKDHKRELEITGIIKIGLDNFEVTASGNVPGKPLNQFSLDEYEGHLRVAVTIGEGVFGWRWGFGGVTESANDVYVLDNNLKIAGSVKDLGLEERIYSARFIENKGYLVTFRQIDPFFVLDLSNPKKPELKGELKIPGYSSYLHPISKDKILGIGKEGSKVKVSLFYVADPKNPTESSKYILDEYWSDILNTHHAFLLDTKHQVFFLPGSRGGYVFSYENNQLGLVKAVSDVRARRAIYINDYLYIIGDDEIVVLNELDWERISELEF